MESWKLEITVDELRTAVAVVLDHWEESRGATLQLSDDYFWSVSAGDKFDDKQKPELSIGQFSWSWANLASARRGDRESTVDYAAVWLAEILSGLGRSGS